MGQAESSSVTRVPRDLIHERDHAEMRADRRVRATRGLSYDIAFAEEYAKVFKPIVRDSRGNFLARDETGMILFDIPAFEQITAFEFAMQFSPDKVEFLSRRGPTFKHLLELYYGAIMREPTGTKRSQAPPYREMQAITSVFSTAKRQLLYGDRNTPERQRFAREKTTTFDRNNLFFKAWVDIVEEAWEDKRLKRGLLNDIKNSLHFIFAVDDFYAIVRDFNTYVDRPTFDQLVTSAYPNSDDCSYCLRYFYVVPAVGLRDADGLPIEFEDRDLESGPYRSLPRLMANAPVNERVALNDPGFLAFLADPNVTSTYPLHADPMMNYLRYVKEVLIPYAADKPNIRVPLVNFDKIYRERNAEPIGSSELEVATEGMRQALSREQGGFESVVTPTAPDHSPGKSDLPAKHWSLWTAQDAVMASLPTAGLGDSYFGRRRIMSRTKFVRLYKRLKGVSSGVASRKYDACMRLLL